MKVYHDHDSNGSWTEITDIITYPAVNPRLDEVGKCMIIIRDFEGALYSTWKDYDFIPMKVEDDDSNLLFRGYLTGKSFKHDQLTLTISGLGAKLEWKSFNRNYVLAEGKVKSVPYSGSISGFSGIVRPNGDVLKEWLVPTVGSFHLKINEGITSPDVPDGDPMIAQGTDAGESNVCSMGTLSIDGTATITKIVVHIYGKDDVDTQSMTVDINLGGWVGAGSVPMAPTYMWVSETFDDLSGTEADLDGLQVKFTAGNNVDNDHKQYVDEMYCIIYYSIANYPYALGLESNNEDNPLLNWNDDQWINDRDVGILVVDSSGVSNVSWDASAESCINGNTKTGTFAGTITKFDESSLRYNDISTGNFNASMELTIDGASIADNMFLQKIEIDYHFALALEMEGITWTGGTLNLQIKKDGNWITKKSFYNSIAWPKTFSGWVEGSIIIEETDTELRKYFDKTGDFYTSLKGLRMLFEGWVESSLNGTMACNWDYLKVKITYSTADISPIMEQVDGNGAEYIIVNGFNWSGAGVAVGDNFKIGENTNKILSEIGSESDLNINVKSTLTKYISQYFKGTYCNEVLRRVCLLEGLHWWEGYIYDRVNVAKETDFDDSGVDLTQANYGWDWEYDDDCNYFYKLEVFGSAGYGIHAFAEDVDVNSPKVKSIIEETIMTIPEAQEIANTQLAIWKVKKPSIKLTLNGVNANLSVGKTVTLTMVRPTVAETQYPIRMIQRSKFGIDGIKTVVSCGLGHSSLGEKIADRLNKISYLAHKAHTDRLISTPYVPGAVITWNDVGGGQVAVEGIITTECGDGQSIDNRIDTLIGTHSGSADHDGRYYTETEINTNIYTKAQVNANTYTRAQVDAHNWLEADITDLDKYTQAEVDAFIDRFDEQSSSFPANPSEGDFHYDEDDDSFFRYNAEAQAWIEIGVGGGKSTADDNLGNHVCTQDLNLSNQQIISNDANTYHYFGRAYVGYASYGDYACFGHRDMRSAGNYSFMQYAEGQTYINTPTGKYITFRVNNSEIAAINANGLLVGSDARITEFDTAKLEDSNTKVPTSKAVRDAIVDAYVYGSYTGNASESKLIQPGAPYFKQITIIRTDSAGAWLKFDGMGTKYSTVMATGVYTDNTIELGGVGLKVWGNCNVNNGTYLYWGIVGTV